MKKALLTIGLASIVALSSHAQGFVVFSSSTQNISTNNPTLGVSGRTQGAGDYYYALFYSTTAISGGTQSGDASGLGGYAWNIAGWTLDTDPTATSASTATAGRFASTAPNTDGSSTVPGVAGGASAYFIIVGWSANLGTTLAAMEANLGSVPGYLGQSNPTGDLVLGNGALVPNPNLFGGAAPQTQAFDLGSTTIPEPGTLALAALGGASLLLFRRKK